MTKNRLACTLWRFLWQHWLQERDVVIAVKGWRTALIDKHGYTRQTVTPMFSWEKHSA